MLWVKPRFVLIVYCCCYQGVFNFFLNVIESTGFTMAFSYICVLILCSFLFFIFIYFYFLVPFPHHWALPLYFCLNEASLKSVRKHWSRCHASQYLLSHGLRRKRQSVSREDTVAQPVSEPPGYHCMSFAFLVTTHLSVL